MSRGRRKESESHIRRLQKMGKYTYYVTIPAREIDELGWREKQRIVVERDGDSFIVRDWKKKGK